MTRKRSVAPIHTRANKRAAAIIEALLKEMQRGVSDQTLLKNPEWERLFGVKQSMVVNLQKLVQALAMLPGDAEIRPNREVAPPEGERLSDEEMRLLTEWLAEGKRAD